MNRLFIESDTKENYKTILEAMYKGSKIKLFNYSWHVESVSFKSIYNVAMTLVTTDAVNMRLTPE